MASEFRWPLDIVSGVVNACTCRMPYAACRMPYAPRTSYIIHPSVSGNDWLGDWLVCGCTQSLVSS